MKNKIISLVAAILLIPSLVVAQGSSDQDWSGGLPLGNNKYLTGLTADNQRVVQILKVNIDGTVSYGTSGVPVVPNNTYIKARNAAGTANIDVLSVGNNDDTYLNGDSGDYLHLAIGGTAEISLDSASLSPSSLIGSTLGAASTPWGNVVQGQVVIDATDVIGAVGTSGLITAMNNSATGDNAAFISYGANTNAATLQAFKTRATTTDANTIVQSGDDILNLVGRAADGTSYRTAAAILMEVDGTPGANDMPGSIDLRVSPDGSTTLASGLKLSNNLQVTLGGTLSFSTAASRIIPGGTSISLRNNANSSDNLIITDAGDATFRGQVQGATLYGWSDGTRTGQIATSAGNTSVVIGSTTNHELEFRANAGEVWEMNPDGTFIGSGTGSVGWTPVDGADNTACTSICTAPAVFGFNLAAGASQPVLVGPSDATADICLCAGAS